MRVLSDKTNFITDDFLINREVFTHESVASNINNIPSFDVVVIDNSTLFNVPNHELFTELNIESHTNDFQPRISIDSELLLILKQCLDEEQIEQFQEQFVTWLEKYKVGGLEVIWKLFNSGKIPSSILSTIIPFIGDVDFGDSTEVQKQFFLYFSSNENLLIRHGTVDGISNMKPVRAVKLLNEIKKKEKNKVIKDIIASNIEQISTLL